MDWSQTVCKLTDEELRVAAEAAKNEQATRTEARESEHRAWILHNIAKLLELTPGHDRSWCTDNKPNNEHDCRRCALLAVRRRDYVPVKMVVGLTVANPPEPYK